MARQSTKESMFAAAAASQRSERKLTAAAKAEVDMARKCGLTSIPDPRLPAEPDIALGFTAGDALYMVHRYIRSITIRPGHPDNPKMLAQSVTAVEGLLSDLKARQP